MTRVAVVTGASQGIGSVLVAGYRAQVSPGVIQTPPNPPEAYAALAKLHPVGHVGQVSDVVAGILYLESADPFVTGEILHIDGGQSAGR